MNLGERIQYYRTQMRLSQEQLAEQLGISRQAVSKWELNDAIPETTKVIQLAKIFGITTDTLLGNEVEVIQGNNDTSYKADWLTKLLDIIKTKGYLVGYYFMGMGVLVFTMGTFAYFSFKRMLIPEGFEEELAFIGGGFKLPLYFSHFIQFMGCLILIGGICILCYGKRQSKVS